MLSKVIFVNDDVYMFDYGSSIVKYIAYKDNHLGNFLQLAVFNLA